MNVLIQSGLLGNMVNGRNKGSSADGSFVKPGTSQQNLSSFQSQAVQSEAGKNFTEMEERCSSDLYRNTSEELFLKSLMESSIGMPVPTMEMLGFKNLSQNLRTDSEELFKTWLTNGENHGYNSTSIVHCTRHTSQRKPAELAGSSDQQLGGVLQRKRSNDNLFPQNTALVDEQSSDLNQNSIRNVVERGLQASNLNLAKAWFHSSQPMTRSRSSELRRRYVSMQNSQTSLGVEAMHNVSGHGVNNLRQEFANPNGFGDVSMCEIPNHFNTFTSPSNSASSTFNAPHTNNIDKVSSVVSMLKGTLEHKKLNNETVEDSSLELYGAQEFLGDMSLNQGQGNRIHETSRTIQDVSSVQVNDHGVLEAVEGSLDMDLDGFVNPTNPMQMSMVSREPSQSESSAAAPAVSTGFDVCDEPTNLGQTMSIGESSKKQVGNGRSSENGTRAKVEKGDSTKKRRVERSRKMAEAKERNLTPPIPSDMQSILKRCENLEKEVRSLKLNLSFMNRKDSEQTKQIEELQKQNEELTEDKEHLLEEIERIIAEPGKM